MRAVARADRHLDCGCTGGGGAAGERPRARQGRCAGQEELVAEPHLPRRSRDDGTAAAPISGRTPSTRIRRDRQLAGDLARAADEDIQAEVAKLISNPVPNGYYPVYIDQPRGHTQHCAWQSYGDVNGVTVQFGFSSTWTATAGATRRARRRRTAAPRTRTSARGRSGRLRPRLHRRDELAVEAELRDAAAELGGYPRG